MNKPKQRITRDTVRYMLRNRIYIGEMSYHDQAQFHPHLAIVDPHVFARVQQRLSTAPRK